jgi:hypothetical protein
MEEIRLPLESINRGPRVLEAADGLAVERIDGIKTINTAM